MTKNLKICFKCKFFSSFTFIRRKSLAQKWPKTWRYVWLFIRRKVVIVLEDYNIIYTINIFVHLGPTKTPTPHTTDAPTPGKTSYPRCAWSDWLSGSTPTDSPTGGDMETMESLRKQFGLSPNIVDIECRIRDNGSVTSATQNSVTCDIHNGLRCYNRDQVSFKCHDYEVKVKCWDDSCE